MSESRKLLKLSVITLFMVGVIAMPALVSAASDGSIDTTGPNSVNKVESDHDTEYEVDNDTDIDATNNNPQDADSGSTKVKFNTEGGDAESGAAMNESSLMATVEVDNSSAADNVGNVGSNGDHDGSISTTGPSSYNRVESRSKVEVDIDNDTDIKIINNNDQDARSGRAEVSHNTTGGDATSGDASNESTTELSFSVTN